jgi:putative ATPase
MDIFDLAGESRLEREAPLAARMRPRVLEEFVGQDHIVGPGRLLRRAIEADQLSSLIFWGPPGTGKTTLAQIIANSTRSHFITINAVLAGVKDIRGAIAEAKDHLGMQSQRTILFVDEVHRFNKAQQDALLPHVENGTIILIGATTENPYFSVNRPLVSRSRIFQLRPLTEDDLLRIARNALSDSERGYGRIRSDVRPEALDHLVNVANGDARGVLNALELAMETTPPNDDGAVVVDMAVAQDSIQRRAVLYDKEGDAHYDTISAFIKSMRGSDPDAVMYWLAKMIYAGEDPRFIFRRMLIFASEDVGLADPRAVEVVGACADAFDRVGLPEGRFHLSNAALYLATAPKSNSTMAIFDALSVVEDEREKEVPSHLKDASRDKEGFGHGQGYLYPHAYRDHWVAQQYLPDSLQGRVFYRPSDQGYEKTIEEQVARHREAQVAAMVEGEGAASGDILTTSRADPVRDRWLQRAISGAGDRLQKHRERVLAAANIRSHHLVLDLNAVTGLLTWEAMRLAPEGGVWTLARDSEAAEALRQQVESLPSLERPTVLEGPMEELPAMLADLRFDAIVGRNALYDRPDKEGLCSILAGFLGESGVISLAEVVPRHNRRLADLVDLSSLGEDLASRIVSAEEAIYSHAQDPLVNWDADDLFAALAATGLTARAAAEDQVSERRITAATIDGWFNAEVKADRPTFAQHLLQRINPDELAQLQALFKRQLTNQMVEWKARTAFAIARKGNGSLHPKS